jgi:hypothetical protein
MRIANGTVNNQCYSSAAEAITWKNSTYAITDLKKTPFGRDSNPFYTIVCRDAALDIKARIRVIVRDWDKTFRIDSDIFNQSYTAPAANMNDNTNDPIFNSPYNDHADWDDNYKYQAASFTPNSCGVQAAGTCSNISGVFVEDALCTGVGGTVVTPASCSDAAKTTYRTCVSSGTCLPADPDAGTCAKNLGVWTPAVWTPSVCTFNNSNQCNYYGGTFAGEAQYNFPQNILGN